MQKYCSKFLINILSCCSYLLLFFFIKQVLIPIKHQTKFAINCKLGEHTAAKKTEDEVRSRVNIELWPGAQLQMSVDDISCLLAVQVGICLLTGSPHQI